jgi:Fic family protein
MVDLSPKICYNFGDLRRIIVMREFNYANLKDRVFDKEIINYVGLIHEFKGRQQLYLEQKPEELNQLIEVAKRQSTEASNEIEGIRTTNARLVQLCEEKTTPKNRDEKEILGYRSVLNTIHENYEFIPLKPNYILQLHRELYSFMDSNFGGKFKDTPNEIDSVLSNGQKVCIFKPLEPWETPDAVERLCNEYNKAISSYGIDPLIVTPIFVHDFLCIHPFNDGNGRMSRLLTTLLLYKSGYVIGRYISIEKKIQTTKSEYYNALSLSSEHWLEETNDDTPFIKYMLGVILAAYRDFEDRVNIVGKKLSAKEMVIKAINLKIGKFTKSDIVEMCPEIGRGSVENALKELTQEGKIERHGSARATFYTRKD